MPCARSPKKPPRIPNSSKPHRTPRACAVSMKLALRASPSCAGSPSLRDQKPRTDRGLKAAKSFDVQGEATEGSDLVGLDLLFASAWPFRTFLHQAHSLIREALLASRLLDLSNWSKFFLPCSNELSSQSMAPKIRPLTA